jgi:hypothetical protein
MQVQISATVYTPTALSLVCAIVLGAGIVHTASSDEEAVRKVVNGFPGAWNRPDMIVFERSSPRMPISSTLPGLTGRGASRSS